MPRFPKGSQEAKDHMASIRAKRGGSPTKTPTEGGRINRSSAPPPLPPLPPSPPSPPSPPPIRRDPNLNLAVVNDERVRRINEITEWLMAGRNASMPVGQFYSQQQMETLRAEREDLERQLQQERETTQGQGIAKKEDCSCCSGSADGAGIIPIFKKPKQRVSVSRQPQISQEALKEIEYMAKIQEVEKRIEEAMERKKAIKEQRDKEIAEKGGEKAVVAQMMSNISQEDIEAMRKRLSMKEGLLDPVGKEKRKKDKERAEATAQNKARLQAQSSKGAEDMMTDLIMMKKKDKKN